MIINISGNSNNNERINGDSNSPLSSKNGNISVNGNNNSRIDGKNGNISVNGDNLGNIKSKNGNINIGRNNNGDINGKNGNISVSGNNLGNIKSKNGEISILGINSSIISSKNGGIYVGGNKGELNTQNGNIDIGDIKIRIKKEGVDGAVNIVSGNINGIVSGSGNIIISNGEVWINGVKQDGNNSNNTNSSEYKVLIDNITIDYNKKTAYIDGVETKISEDINKEIRIIGNKIEVTYKQQIIKIYEDYVSIKGV